MGVDPECHGRISVAEPRGHHMAWDPGQEQGSRSSVEPAKTTLKGALRASHVMP